MSNEFEMGQGLGHQFEKALARNGWTKALVHQVCGGDFLTNVRLVLEGKARIMTLDGQPLLATCQAEIVELTIDYSRSLEQMIVVGRYDSFNKGIFAKGFFAEGEGVEEVEAKLFHFGQYVYSKDVIAEIKKAGWEVAKTEHLLAFGRKFPEEQYKYPIVAIGSIAESDNRHSAPVLVKYENLRRGLALWCSANGWKEECRFLVVRKKKKVS